MKTRLQTTIYLNQSQLIVKIKLIIWIQIQNFGSVPASKQAFCEQQVFLEIVQKRGISALRTPGILARPPQRVNWPRLNVTSLEIESAEAKGGALTLLWNAGGGGWKRLPKFKFSAKFTIGLHVILQIQIRKFENDCYIMWKIILTENPLRFNVEPLFK